MRTPVLIVITSCCCLGAGKQALADFSFAPVIDTNLYLLEEVETNDFIIENEAALELAPSLAVNYTSRTLNSDWDFKHRYLHHESPVLKEQNITDVTLNNTLALLENRLEWDLDLSRTNQALDSRQSFLNDSLYGQADYADVNQFVTRLKFSNLNEKQYRIKAAISAAKVDYDQTDVELDSSLPLYSPLVNGNTYSANAELGFGRNINKLYGELYAEASLVDKEGFNEQESQRASAHVGLPLFYQFAITANARHEKNDLGRQLNRDQVSYDSWGAGIAYRLSERSYAEVSYNYSDQADDEEFWSYRIKWQPSNRTQLFAEYLRRFYGDAGKVAFSWRHKKLAAQFNYNEGVSSVNRFQRFRQSEGFFVCSSGEFIRDDCFALPSNFNLAEDQQVVEIIADQVNVINQIIVNKQAEAEVSYKYRSLTLNFELAYGKKDFLDSPDQQQDYRAKLSANWNMGRKNKFNASIQARKLDFSAQQRKDDSYSVNLGFERTISTDLVASVNYKRTERDSNQQDTFIDSRGWLNVKYTF